jgi:threonine-phosphate decarboxylase
MTKFFGIPGLRLGYALSSSALAEQLDDMGGPWSVNTMAQTAGVAALQDSEHNRRTLEYVTRERRDLFDRLSELKQLKVYPSSANFLLVEITRDMSSMELRDLLMRQRILIRDCTNFTGLSPKFFRIAVRTREENELLLEALKRVLK